PPQQHRVHDLVGILVDHLAATGLFDGGTNVVVGVLVPAELLDHHPVCNAKLLSVILRVRRGDHGGVLLNPDNRQVQANMVIGPSASRSVENGANVASLAGYGHASLTAVRAALTRWLAAFSGSTFAW